MEIYITFQNYLKNPTQISDIQKEDSETMRFAVKSYKKN